MSYRDKKYNTMLVTVEDHIATVQFNRPEVLNAINNEVNRERAEIFTALGQDPDVRVVILTGGEKVFSAGGDLPALSKYGIVEAREHADNNYAGQRALAEMPKPTIAAIAGYAMGGGAENVLLCDLRIAADNAKIACSEINVGIFPGGGATHRLVQNLSMCQAKEMLFFGGMIDAQKALEMGLVNKVVPVSELMSTAKEWAQKLAQKPPFTLKMLKAVMHANWGLDTETAMRVEHDAWTAIFGSEDAKEGMRAFIEKRKPEYKGK
ncbi:enoyl-coa hydratase [hydrocarbon metagenome]|uniref:Enoyl-coa hydratase n=1 Tax=hydrocarbon metagenome TaxID=938273 RepID=A0A0W8E4M8_9ZZZZ